MMIIDDEIHDGFLYNVCMNCDHYKHCKDLDFEDIDNCINGREDYNMELFLEEKYLQVIMMNDKQLKPLCEYLLQKCHRMTDWTLCTSINGCEQCNLHIAKQIKLYQK